MTNLSARRINASDERELKDIARKAIASSNDQEEVPVTFVMSLQPRGIITISSFIGIITLPPSKSYMTFVKAQSINSTLMNDVVDHGQDPLWEWLHDVSFTFIGEYWAGRKTLPTSLTCQIGSAVQMMFLHDYPEVIARINEVSHLTLAQRITDFN